MDDEQGSCAGVAFQPATGNTATLPAHVAASCGATFSLPLAEQEHLEQGSAVAGTVLEPARAARRQLGAPTLDAGSTPSSAFTILPVGNTPARECGTHMCT